uniref:Tub domain-containing protein n=1 Tax=Macrostomum lignano TaxID=282301 RepID=A0A1I8IQH2_9PLAT
LLIRESVHAELLQREFQLVPGQLVAALLVHPATVREQASQGGNRSASNQRPCVFLHLLELHNLIQLVRIGGHVQSGVLAGRSSTSETLSLSTAQARVDFGSPGWSSVAIKSAVQSKEESRELPDGVLVAAGSDYSNCESNSIAQQLFGSRIGCSNFRMMQMTDAASRHARHVLQGLSRSKISTFFDASFMASSEAGGLFDKLSDLKELTDIGFAARTPADGARIVRRSLLVLLVPLKAGFRTTIIHDAVVILRADGQRRDTFWAELPSSSKSQISDMSDPQLRQQLNQRQLDLAQQKAQKRIAMSTAIVQRNSSAASMQGSRPGSATAGKENERSPLLLPILGLNAGERASHFAYDGPQAFQNPDGPSPTHQLEAVAAKMSSLELSASPNAASCSNSIINKPALSGADSNFNSPQHRMLSSSNASSANGTPRSHEQSSVRQSRMPSLRLQPFHQTDIPDLGDFALQPAGRDAAGSLKCRISRHSRGMDGSRYPTYYLHLERDDGKRSFLLAARKRKRSSTSNYLISCDPTDLSRRGEGYVGKLRANFLGTAFTVFDSGLSPKKLTAAKSPEASRRELAGITYETNVLGFRAPRKMTVVLPAMLEAEEGDCVRVDIRPNSEEEGLVERLKRREMSHLMELHNRTPRPSPMCSTFTGRVTQASVKNFQIVRDNDGESIWVTS